MSASRKAAVKAVVRLHKGGWANLTAKTYFSVASLDNRDKAFASALFYGTAERLVTLDYFLQPFVKKPLAKLDVEVRSILETGLYQVLYMNVPARAAVNESVKLTRSMGKSSAAGMVNAVLRKAVDSQLEKVVFTSELERVCVTYSVGEAVAKAIMQALPEEYDAFFAASFSKPELCLRVNTFKNTQEDFLAMLIVKGIEARKGFVPNAVYSEIGSVISDEMFQQGRYHVQGEASQYVCCCVDAQQGESVLDLCAAPGGKSATLVQYTKLPTSFCSCDVRENRIPLLAELFNRLGIEGVRIELNDAAQYNKNLGCYDKVLCDVPCTGLGVLSAKPDIRYTDGENFELLPNLQLQILSTAAQYVKKGGRLVYSTCTVRPQENGEIVKAFLAKNTNFKMVPINKLPILPPKGSKIEEEMITFHPHSTNLDGFFVATLEKIC